jgi:hypothetical protein
MRSTSGVEERIVRGVGGKGAEPQNLDHAVATTLILQSSLILFNAMDEYAWLALPIDIE